MQRLVRGRLQLPGLPSFQAVSDGVLRPSQCDHIAFRGRPLARFKSTLPRAILHRLHKLIRNESCDTGQNAISQARLFNEVAEITGLVLMKLDGTAKGGVIIGLANEFQIPVHFVGVGEGVDDLREFDSLEFIEALFGESKA